MIELRSENLVCVRCLLWCCMLKQKRRRVELTARSLAVINLKFRVKEINVSWWLGIQWSSGAHNNGAHHECRLKSLGADEWVRSRGMPCMLVRMFQTWMSPDKFLDAAFFVSCVALRNCDGRNKCIQMLRETTCAVFRVLCRCWQWFLRNGGWSHWTEILGLRGQSMSECFVRVYLLLDRLRQTIGLDL